MTDDERHRMGITGFGAGGEEEGKTINQPTSINRIDWYLTVRYIRGGALIEQAIRKTQCDA